MDLSLIIFLIVTAFFIYRGFRNGFLKSFSRVIGLAAGYVVVIFFIRPLAGYLQSQTGLEGFIPLILAGTVLFIGTSIIVSILFSIIGKLLPKQESPSNASAFGGAGIGLLTGLLVATIAVWGLNYVREMNQVKTAGDQPVESTNTSFIGQFASKAAGKAVSGALTLADAQPEVSRLSGALMESPAELTQQVKRLSSSVDLQALLGDPKNQAVLNSGNINAVQQLPAFKRLMQNPDMQQLAKTAGLTDGTADDSTNQTELATKFSDVWQRIQHVKNNPRFQAIINDPEFKDQVQSGNPVTLLGNSQLMELTDIIFSDEATPKAPVEEFAPAKPQKPAKVYSWKDDKGRIHYSDKNPDRQ